ncbi:MAG TPA: class I SAM-dependent methyltransferase [Catalimonadaceae bacterium]|nr:class I SAM-dependent methyltransferase [Catalimonadaceae bacterium]
MSFNYWLSDMLPSFPHSLFTQPDSEKKDGVFLLETRLKEGKHEKVYIRIREKEGHLIRDTQVLALPNEAPAPEFQHLWVMRKQSAVAVCAQLGKTPNPSILELGCGNGWFSHMLSSLPGSFVLGMDMNKTELGQAARLFQTDNLAFAFGDIEQDPLLPEKFDFVVLNAAIQYFNDIPGLLHLIRKLLKKTGEIHIFDSAFHLTKADQEKARARSRKHFAQMGEPDMIHHFHHPLWSEIKNFQPKIRYFNRNLLKKVLRIPQNPMPWVVIGKGGNF